MTVVLGIDAAWKKDNPSGVAMVAKSDGRWRCLGVAPSYDEFIRLAEEGHKINWCHKQKGGVPDIQELLNAAKNISEGQLPDVIAVDMPIWRRDALITGRRTSDDEISKAFGRCGAGTFTPKPSAPGEQSKKLVQSLIKKGYGLQTQSVKPTQKNLIEVYPHPALLTLLNSPYRLPYKAGNTKSYWPKLSLEKRIGKLLTMYRRIISALDGIIDSINLPIPPKEAATLASLKPYEDALDALVCAWVGICYLEGSAKPFGDDESAIWVPDKLSHLASQLARIPSFTNHENRIKPLVRQYCRNLFAQDNDRLSVHIKQVKANNLVIEVPGTNNNQSHIAFAAHLDKINHFGAHATGPLPVALEGDEIVGQLDDAVGLAICLHLLAECVHIRNRPPILVLLSEMEETVRSSIHYGSEQSAGAHRIADYLIDVNKVPEVVITIDTSSVFGKTGGIALYSEFWEMEGTAAQDQSEVLLKKTRELVDRVMKLCPNICPANGVNDYVTYGRRFNERRGSAIPSIAIEPAIYPIHAIGERMKIADIRRTSAIAVGLLQ